MNSAADLCRLLAVPAFAWIAWRDVATRRVADRIWVPLICLALLALAIDLVSMGATARRPTLVRVGVSVGLVVPLSYLFWRFGGFGGADAKAFMVLALLFPVYPTFTVLGTTVPEVETALGIFSLTIVTNTVLVGLFYPLSLAIRNALCGVYSLRGFVAQPVPTESVATRYGRLLDTDTGRGGLDVDALRMYLRWRGLTLAEVRAHPTVYRDPASLPREGNPPGDGAIVADSRTDGGVPTETELPIATPRIDVARTEADSSTRTASYEDPWGAATFLAAIESSAYGTTPAALEDGLDALAANERVWITPGIPFLVPLFFGLCLAFVYGDVLFGGLRALGLL